MNPTWYFACRVLTGAGIGGEYAAINSAIDELIPAKYRGRIDIAINGSFWVGAAAGALLTIPLLDPTRDQPGDRLAACVRARRGPRRRHPASCAATCPRARAGCSSTAVRTRPRRSSATSRTPSRRRPAKTCRASRRPSRSASARRSALPQIAKTVFTLYPKRTVLCFALFVGQAFLYNAFFFTYGDSLSTFLGREADRLVHRRLRGQQLPGRAAARPAVRHGRPRQDDRRHLHRVRRAARRRRRHARRPQRRSR